MNKAIIMIDEDVLSETIDMTPYDRLYYLKERNLIPDYHLYGYGVYSGAYIEDSNHVSYKIGSSCD